jgi:hypothetical protein
VALGLTPVPTVAANPDAPTMARTTTSAPSAKRLEDIGRGLGTVSDINDEVGFMHH